MDATKHGFKLRVIDQRHALFDNGDDCISMIEFKKANVNLKDAIGYNKGEDIDVIEIDYKTFDFILVFKGGHVKKINYVHDVEFDLHSEKGLEDLLDVLIEIYDCQEKLQSVGGMV